MANDISNATAAFAVAMKSHEFVAKKLAAEAEAAKRFKNGYSKLETGQVADGSMPASQVTEDLEEDAIDPTDAQGSSHAPDPPFMSSSANIFIPSLYAQFPLRAQIRHNMRRPL